MNQTQIAEAITAGNTALGIELGSTRIKGVLVGPDNAPIASGSHAWENRLENGIWTYPLEAVWQGVQECYANLVADVRQKYGVTLTKPGAIGVSAMMHGYLAFDAQGNLLVPFRTWRNTITEPAAKALTAAFDFNIPQRWSIAHLYQAVLNNEPHLPKIAHVTTLAGYVHWKLTGETVLGVGDASGVFPIDSTTNDYDTTMVQKFDALVAKAGCAWRLGDLLPKVLCAGDAAGTLTEEGAKLLDVSGTLQAGVPFCPPEGDAGTGMAATNSVAQRTGNVSAGTSVFAMIVLETAMKQVHTEIDMVTTPTGSPVAMVHCNNCSSDIDAWTGLLREFAQQATGQEIGMGKALDTLFFAALDAQPDGGGLVSCNYYSGEPITGLDEGRPLFARKPDAKLTLANFARTQLYSAMATLKIGMDILLEQEQVGIDSLLGHGGYFKAEGVGAKMLAAALNTPVSVMKTAGEGGPWGMALLAAYRKNKQNGETLEQYLRGKVFANAEGTQVQPDAADVAGFATFMQRYAAMLEAEKALVKAFT